VKSISKETTVTHFIHRDNARENTAVINGAVQAANREDLRCIQRVNFSHDALQKLNNRTWRIR
jgi:hypothetical protein